MTTDQNNGSTGETQDQEQQDQQNQATDETSGNGQEQQVTIDDSTQLPETHPLVKTLAANKTKIASQATELSEARAQAARATQLEDELGKRPTTEALETLQTRYDRLEAFVLEVGLGKALDSRTFTKELFETDKDIAAIVKDWHKANPSATSKALGGGSGGGSAEPKQDPNALLRAAYNGGQ